MCWRCVDQYKSAWFDIHRNPSIQFNTTLEPFMDLTEQDNNLVISEISLSELSSIRKWTFFLAIMGFIGSAFTILFGLFFGVMSKFISHVDGTSRFPGILMMLLYLIIGIIYFFPSLFLLNFSSKIKAALETHTESPFAEALNYLRLHFKFMGILAIVGVVVVFLGIFIAIILAIIAAAHAGA
jgi:hypothetical protein